MAEFAFGNIVNRTISGALSLRPRPPKIKTKHRQGIMTDSEHIEELKAAADPKKVAESLGLRGRGKRFFCPSCQPQGGKTPDLAVLDKGFHCHKCGIHGDTLDLVILAGMMEFHNAIIWLEQQTGIRQPDREKGGYRDKGGSKKSRPGALYAPSAIALDARKPKTAEKPDPAVYAAFLAGCRPVEGKALDFLTKTKGIAPEVVAALGLRFCGREYSDIMTDLKTRFGEKALHTAGLLKPSSKKPDLLVPSFWHYYAKKAGFLVIPYIKDGRPVYLKARPPVSKEDAERLELVRFMNTAATVPCLYNVDALKAKPDRILICEGESDTWTALSYGFAAVGSPGVRNFKPSWVELFRDCQKNGRSSVFLVMDADKAGNEGSRIIADLFLKADLPVPLKMTIPSGKDLNQFMRNMGGDS